MSTNSRSLYLTKSRTSSKQRAHLAIFVPNANYEGPEAMAGFDPKASSCRGTVINVVGEPVMAGYVLEIDRNYDLKDSHDLKELILLGHTDVSNIYEPPKSSACVMKDHPRGKVELEASRIAPPPRGQDIRAPVDAVNTKRCQEWTMEVLEKLVEEGLVSSEAITIAQSHRDAPTHGIFGMS